VEGGVRPHQREPPDPVEVGRDDVANLRPAAIPGLELVDDIAAGLLRRPDRPRPAIRGPQDRAAIGRLAAAARVEHRPVEDDDRGVAAVIDRDDPALDRPEVGVGVAELTGGIHR
jgi:hypothetical protein